jgi:hypothetical protein
VAGRASPGWPKALGVASDRLSRVQPLGQGRGWLASITATVLSLGLHCLAAANDSANVVAFNARYAAVLFLHLATSSRADGRAHALPVRIFSTLENRPIIRDGDERRHPNGLHCAHLIGLLVSCFIRNAFGSPRPRGTISHTWHRGHSMPWRTRENSSAWSLGGPSSSETRMDTRDAVPSQRAKAGGGRELIRLAKPEG